mgnify:CR=1 FL=1
MTLRNFALGWLQFQPRNFGRNFGESCHHKNRDRLRAEPWVSDCPVMSGHATSGPVTDLSGDCPVDCPVVVSDVTVRLSD